MISALDGYWTMLSSEKPVQFTYKARIEFKNWSVSNRFLYFSAVNRRRACCEAEW